MVNEYDGTIEIHGGLAILIALLFFVAPVIFAYMSWKKYKNTMTPYLSAQQLQLVRTFAFIGFIFGTLFFTTIFSGIAVGITLRVLAKPQHAGLFKGLAEKQSVVSVDYTQNQDNENLSNNSGSPHLQNPNPIGEFEVELEEPWNRRKKSTGYMEEWERTAESFNYSNNPPVQQGSPTPTSVPENFSTDEELVDYLEHGGQDSPNYTNDTQSYSSGAFDNVDEVESAGEQELEDYVKNNGNNPFSNPTNTSGNAWNNDGSSIKWKNNPLDWKKS